MTMQTVRSGIAILAVAGTLLCSAAASAQQMQPSPPPVCGDCGVVQNVRQVQQQGQSSGAGAVVGGVLGGVLGHQIGSGRGNTVATIAGAAGGAVVGNEVEKNRNTSTHWEVSLTMDSGQPRTFTYSSQPSVRPGDHVKLIDGGRRLALLAN
jgi:outer membrane lipoprotein SlyB